VVSTEEAEVGKRIRLVREEYGVSQRLAADQMGLSRPQLKRIELGQVAIRPSPALRFCRFTNRSPLWLAFGEPENRFGFFWPSPMESHAAGWETFKLGVEWGSDPALRESVTFLELMRKNKARFNVRGVRFLGTSDTEPGWRVGLREPASKLRLGLPAVNPPLTTTGKSGTFSAMRGSAFWPILRERIRKLVQQRGTKAALAREIGISRQAVNALLGKKYVPSGEITLRLFEWVRTAEAKQENAPEVHSTRPALKARKRKARSNAKPKPSQRKG
jgi:transcriptional regulator with XRE-family HTH domain